MQTSFVLVSTHMVNNFCEGFIFVFFVSREQFSKIKTTIFSLPTKSDFVSSWCYFKLPSHPSSNRSL